MAAASGSGNRRKEEGRDARHSSSFRVSAHLLFFALYMLSNLIEKKSGGENKGEIMAARWRESGEWLAAKKISWRLRMKTARTWRAASATRRAFFQLTQMGVKAGAESEREGGRGGGGRESWRICR